MPGQDGSPHSSAEMEPRFLRRFAGKTRIVVIGLLVTLVPIMVTVPWRFADDDRLGWTIASALIAVVTIVFLLFIPLLGYRIDAEGIASRQGLPPRFTDTMQWSDVEVITWMAGPVRGLTDNCTVWSSRHARPVWARWLYDAQATPAGRAAVQQREQEVGPLKPMMITLSSISHSNLKRLCAAFEAQGFAPLPEHRRDYNSTASRPTVPRQPLE